jgi:cation:H+ antiporter
MGILIGIMAAIFASFIIAKACDGFEDAADFLGRNLSEGTKGATINAIGSSMPELLVTTVYLFFFMDTSGFAGGIGTTAGSAVFNALVIPALVILFVLKKNKDAVISISKPVILRDGLVLIAAEIALIFIIGDSLQWYHGLILMSIYMVYAGWMMYRHNTSDDRAIEALTSDDDEEDDPNLTTFNALVKLAIAIVFISGASYVLVYGCELIGEGLHISGYFIAVIIAAAASSIPDTILSIKDANKGNYDDAVANALGSNIFDICFALGLPVLIYTLINGPIILEKITMTNVVELRIVLLILTTITFFILLLTKRINKFTGYMLLSMYLGFVGFVIYRAGF